MSDTGSKSSVAPKRFVLRLFVTGSTARSMRAIENTRWVCDTYLGGVHQLEVVDLYQFPETAAQEQIIASPTLVKLLPKPKRSIIGDLSDRNRVLAFLGLGAAAKATL